MPAASANLTQTAALARGVTALSVATAGILVVLKAVICGERIGGPDGVHGGFRIGPDRLAGDLVAVRYAAAPPDAEHRYGHGKAEAFAGLIQAGLVFASAALIAQEAVRHIITPSRGAGRLGDRRDGSFHGAHHRADRAQTRLLNRTDSVAISADRTHYAADLASNLIALAGSAPWPPLDG